jgi:hypothetical protein
MLKASQPVIPPIVPPPAIPATKDYSFSWGPPLTNLDGTVLTNLTGYLISNATSSIGPFLTWNMVGSGVTTYTYKALSTAIPQCFAIAGFSSSNGAGAPLVFCQPSLMTAPGPVTKVN